MGWFLEAVIYIVLPLASKGMVGRRNNLFANKDPEENHGDFFTIQKRRKFA
jgi:hypothetical protein